MDIDNFSQALEAIADLVIERRNADNHLYEIVRTEGHFACRQTGKVDKNAYLIIKFRAQDTYNGFTDEQWDTVSHRLRVLIETGVIK